MSIPNSGYFKKLYNPFLKDDLNLVRSQFCTASMTKKNSLAALIAMVNKKKIHPRSFGNVLKETRFRSIL